MINYQQALRSGLGLDIVGKLSRKYHTYQVQDSNGEQFVARLSPRVRDVSYYRDLVAEAEMLEALKDPITIFDPRLSPLADVIPRVPRLHGLKYGTSEVFISDPHQVRRKSEASFLVLLKEYIPGSPLEEDQLLDVAQTESLRNTIYAIQKAGFCNPDVSRRNIIIDSRTSLPFLVDISGAMPQSRLEGTSFEQLSLEDLEAVDDLGVG